MSSVVLRGSAIRRTAASLALSCRKKASSASEPLQPRRHSSDMHAPPVEYGYIEDTENPERYCPGGYHPVQIGDLLGSRYRVVHKLGHGSFSTAWLALDNKTSRYVAAKLGTADADRREIKILSQLNEGTDKPELFPSITRPIPVLLDQFEIEGPNGTHPCLVTEPARCSVQYAKQLSGGRLFRLDVARSLAFQLTMALSVVHSKGYVHGDLHLGNMLLRLSSEIHSLTPEQLYTQYDPPEEEPLIRLDTQKPSTEPGVPSSLILPISLGIPSHDVAIGDAVMILNDYGVAFCPSQERRFESYAPIAIRSPEAFFEPTVPLTFASDVWSLGCVIFELLAHRSLIDVWLAPDDEITAQQIHLQGKMPQEWWGNWEKRAKWFDEGGTPLSRPGDIWPWERKIEEWVQEPRRRKNMGELSVEEVDALLRLLKGMLAWRPDHRPTVEQVLQSPWMTEWAYPAYQQTLKTNSTNHQH